MSEGYKGDGKDAVNGHTKYEPNNASVVKHGGNEAIHDGIETSGGIGKDTSGYEKSKQVNQG